MHREAGILQQRIEARTFERHGIKPPERIGGEKNEEHEGRGEKPLHAQRRRRQTRTAPLSARHQCRIDASTSTQSSIEPSWFPHTPLIL